MTECSWVGMEKKWMVHVFSPKSILCFNENKEFGPFLKIWNHCLYCKKILYKNVPADGVFYVIQWFLNLFQKYMKNMSK